MKILTSLLILVTVISNNMCSQQDFNIEKVTFNSRTRGGSKMMEVKEKEILFRSNGDQNLVDLKDNSWTELTETIMKMEYKKIQSFKADKKDRARDAAWHSSITITISGVEYESLNFDDADAPVELTELMDMLVNLDNVYNSTDKSLFNK